MPTTRTDEFLDPRYRAACRNSGMTILRMSVLAGFPNYTHLSYLLNAETIKPSPLVVVRLQRLADAVGYRGPILLPALAPENAEALS